MDKIKEIIKEKNFVINPLILKNIKKFNLNINEFLLLLYFINIKNELNIEQINKYLSLSEEEIMNSFDLLIKKAIIEIKIVKIDNKIEEEISLDSFYNKLILDLPEEKNSEDIFTMFENEFGRTLSPIEYETINYWIDNNISIDIIKKALKEAVLNGVTNLKYIDKIIYEWTKKKLNINDNKELEVKIFEYDWLDEDNEGK